MSEPRSWSGCDVRVLDAAGAALYQDDDCDVRLDGDSLVVTYFDDEGPLVFSGLRKDDGSFDLWCRGRVRRGSLAFSPEGDALQGEWSEGEERGRWHIALQA